MKYSPSVAASLEDKTTHLASKFCIPKYYYSMVLNILTNYKTYYLVHRKVCTYFSI
jgi:hypothetical protein